MLLGASYRAHLGRNFFVEGFAGPSLELVHYAGQARADVVFTPGPPANELRPQLVFGLVFGLGSAPGLALIPELGVALGRTQYELERAGKREVVARAPRLTPGLALSLEL